MNNKVSPALGIMFLLKKTTPRTGDMDMVKVASVFAQVLSLINRNDFLKSVSELDAEKAAKSFCCWERFVCMLFCHLASADSFREINIGLGALGCFESP